MGQEIERKFLVANLPDVKSLGFATVRQGYLTETTDSVEIRIRQKADRFFLTLKSGAGLVRVEREAEITANHFDTFWPETEGRRVEKDRFSGQLANGARFELDLFSGPLAALQLVEVEFASKAEADAFLPPDWFGKEVTDDERYKNKALATDGIPV